MNEREKTFVKFLIRTQIKELEDILEASKPAAEQKHNQADDQAAKLGLTISSEVEGRLVQIARNELKQLMQNLTWLDGEDAGCCELCGDDIPLDRLVAVLTTRWCVDCAENDENSL